MSPEKNSKLIDAVISKLRGEASPPPPWANGLDIAGVSEIQYKITDLESKKTEIKEEITKLKSAKANLSKYGKLLYATGKPLERIVRDAFRLLGFTEIAKPEGDGEDWKIEFKYVPNVDIGVLEVKGVEKRTGRKDLVQCNVWLDKYFVADPSTLVKGILVPSQHRLNKFPESKDDRKHFEPNELEYAETKKICIIPTYVLFEAVNLQIEARLNSRFSIQTVC